MVHDAPTFEAVAGDIAVRLHGACFVAHNVPFDVRMLTNEFAKLGDDFVVTRAIDTYVESGCRLSRACEVFDIDLTGAHRARTDAWATAQLFLQVTANCDRGGPLAAPFGLNRTGRVLRREDAAPVRLTEPPLITFLASRLPLDNLEVRQQEYLELVGRAVADLHIDRAERFELAAIATELRLTEAQVTQAHRRFVNELVDAALEDNEVTDEEYDMLVRVASALGVDQTGVEARISSHRIAETLSVLVEGMQVVFTGGHPTYERDELQSYAAGIGLVVGRGVSKQTGFVCAADAATTSGKASLARRYGIPIVAVDEFVHAQIGDVLVGSGAGQVGLKVVTCRDCLSTWTVPATTGTSSTRRCDPCAALAQRAKPPTIRRQRTSEATNDLWAPPIIEWLSCLRCTAAWSREVSRGRKPHFCPNCEGLTVLPIPV